MPLSELTEARSQSICAVCQAIPVELFSRGRAASASAITGDCCYQHYSGPDALLVMSNSSRQGCALCTILWFSLQAMRQFLPGPFLKKATFPKRLPTETGITLHSFDKNHFIVMDDSRWSFVRFAPGDRVNEKGW